MKPHILGPDFSTFARSVRLYCEEKTLEYTHGLQVDGSSIARHSAEHLALHPFGKVPVLLHGERQVFETTSICRYLDAAFPQSSLQPHDLAQRTEVDQWSAALALYVDDRLIRRYLLLIASPIPRPVPSIPKRWPPPRRRPSRPWTCSPGNSATAHSSAAPATAWPTPCSPPCWTICSNCPTRRPGWNSGRTCATTCNTCACARRVGRCWDRLTGIAARHDY